MKIEVYFRDLFHCVHGDIIEWFISSDNKVLHIKTGTHHFVYPFDIIRSIKADRWL